MKNEEIEEVDKFKKQIWKSNIYSRNTKIKIYNINVTPMLLYGCECWKINSTEIKKCEASQNRCLRRVMKIHSPNTISNNQLLKLSGTIKLDNEIKMRRWKYIGHIHRRDKGDTTKIALTCPPGGKQSRGRPKETWKRTVEREMREMGWKDWGAAEKMATERPKWKSLCLALCSTRNEEDR